jgi:hypothetical protein
MHQDQHGEKLERAIRLGCEEGAELAGTILNQSRRCDRSINHQPIEVAKDRATFSGAVAARVATAGAGLSKGIRAPCEATRIAEDLERLPRLLRRTVHMVSHQIRRNDGTGFQQPIRHLSNSQISVVLVA